MTHETAGRPEAAGGPERDEDLPAAGSVPGDLAAADADADDLEEDLD